MALRLALLAAAAAVAAATDANIVLPPVQNTTGLPEQMLVFIPGGKVPNTNYVATAQAIQQAATGLRLWVVIPGVFQRLCIITCSSSSLCAPLHSGVEASLAQAKKMGWTRPAKDSDGIWIAGHSLGGVCANYLFQGYSSNQEVPYAGIIEMGSYVDENGTHDLTHYPKPVLTMNGELDGGLARPGKTAVWWSQFLGLEQSKGADWTVTNKPVMVLPKMNHSDFCPGFDVAGDLMAEVDQETATTQIGAIVAAFLHLHKADKALAPAAVSALKEPIEWTRRFLAPYLAAQRMEQNISATASSEEGASPVCERGQHIISGLSADDDKRMAVSDEFHAASKNLMHCHPNWTATADGLEVRTCGHADYYRDIANTGEITAASEIACKMLSAERIGAELKAKTDLSKDCRDINRFVVQLAESMAPASTLERFRKVGRGWCFEEDTPVLGDIGPLWVFQASMKYSENATCMAVSSSSLKTGLDSKIYPGSHYCKVLSPARVLDWMMTDSLKKPKAIESVSIFV